MNYHRTFFFFLVLFAAAVVLAGGLPVYGKWLFIVCAAFAGAALLKKFALSPWKELEASLHRIKSGDLQARLDDVKGGDVRASAVVFNELAEDLAKYKKLYENREKRLTALINSVNSGLMLFDPEGEMLLANANMPGNFAHFRREAPIASLDIPFLPQFLDEAKKTGQRQTRELKEGGKGRGRIFEITYVPLEEGNWALIIHDISSEARMAQVKSDLVANVSHELRTPISAVSSICDVLDDEAIEAGRKADFLGRLKKQARRMSSLVEDLLSLSRLESGEITVKNERVNLSSLIDDILNSLEPLRKTFGVEFESTVDRGLTVSGDPALIEHAAKNILDNAIRYNKQNGKVFIRAEKDDGAVRLEIEDTGDGIPAEYSERVFERFFRVDPHRSRERGGTGLGLSIAKHSLMLLNGDVRLESEIGKGSKFIITLPE